MHVRLHYYLHSLIDVGLIYKQTDGLSVTPICLCSQVCLPRSGPSYKPVFMGSERPLLANNWRLDCSVSIWRVSGDRLGPAVLWKGQSNPDSAGDGKMTGKEKVIKTGRKSRRGKKYMKRKLLKETLKNSQRKCSCLRKDRRQRSIGWQSNDRNSEKSGKKLNVKN